MMLGLVQLEESVIYVLSEQTTEEREKVVFGELLYFCNTPLYSFNILSLYHNCHASQATYKMLLYFFWLNIE